MYHISEPDRFEPSAKLILGDGISLGGRGYIPAKQNPTKRELASGTYKPRLTLTNRYNYASHIREATLKVELSLPKLLFGNNFDELSQEDFEPVTEKLRKVLQVMGVFVFTNVLEKAPVSAIHYSKNIPLTDGMTPHYIIGKIKEANTKLSLDINQTDYRNEGYSYKWHSNSYEVAFYDKIKDLETAFKSEKRAIENDNLIQLNLFEPLKKRNKFEVLRMEVRLNKRQKIGMILKAIGISTELTYKNLFNMDISKKVLLHYLDEIEKQRFSLFDYRPTSPKDLITNLIVNNPKLRLKRIIQLYGLKHIFDSINPRELRAMFGNQNSRNWYRLVSEAKTIKLPITENPLGVIRRHLVDFNKLKMIDFN